MPCYRFGSHRQRLALALIVGLFALQGALAFTPPFAAAAECEGDECQGPAPAPDDPIPGTALVEGPPNPPVHYPKVHKKNPHKAHHRKHHRHAPNHRLATVGNPR